MTARERFDREVDALMTLQVMVSVKTLRALIALERSVIGRLLLLRMRVRRVLVQVVVHVRCMATVEAKWHARSERTVDKLHLAVWILHV